MRDLRYALRSLRRTPGFSLTAILALTIGIGASTSVFSVVDRVLFRPLPYRDANRLVSVGADVRSRGQSNWAVDPVEFVAWREAARTLADLAGYQPSGRFTLTLPDEPVEVSATRVTETFFAMLGTTPALGRLFNPDDFAAGAPRVILVTDAAWRQRFGSDPLVVGRGVTINAAPATVVGVLPRTFAFPTDATRSIPEILLPFAFTAGSSSGRLTMIGRLAPDATVEVARTEINALAAARGGDSGLRNAVIDGATVEPLADRLSTAPRRVMLLLVGAVAALLLLGCANVANLLVARGTDRQGEIALRRALGASRRDVVRLLLAESLLLALAAGLAGALLAFWAVGVIGPLVPRDLELLGPIEVNSRALLFASAAGALCVLLSAVAPALGASAVPLQFAINQASSRATSARLRLRQVIVGLQVALAVVLLTGGVLMINSMVRLMRVDVGYLPDDALTMRLQLPRGEKFPGRSTGFVEQAIAAARIVPGVLAAGASEGVPLANALYAGHYSVEGFSDEWMAQGASNGGGACCTQTQWVSADFFAATGIRILRGRPFITADAAKAPAVALIGERLARKFPGGLDPVGHYLVGADASDRRLIVGVVRDVRDMALERPALQTIYLPMEERGASALTLVMRTSVAPLSIAGAVREAVQRQAGPLIVSDVMTMKDVIARAAGPRRLNAWLFGTFGVFALLLTAIGIGSVVSYGVARRTREIGIRLALGATGSQVRGLVVIGSLVPVVVGLIVGVGAAASLSRLVASFLYDVTPRDVWTYVLVIALLLTTALAAAYLPARRAARVDPLEALRAE